MKIEMGKKYRTVDGRPVRILCIDGQSMNSSYPVITLVTGAKSDTLSTYTENGQYNNALTSPSDLVECNVWDDWKIDDKVMVMDYEETGWYRRRYAGLTENGFPCTFPDGADSWTYSNEYGYNTKVEWKHIRVPTEDELVLLR